MKYILFISICVIVALLGCTSTNHKTKEGKAISKTLFHEDDKEGESFSNFIEKFHTDSIFQLQRINHEVKGYNSNDEELDDNDSIMHYLWNKSDLIYYLHMIDGAIHDTKYDCTLSSDGDSIFSETISLPQSSCFYTLDFSKIDNKWVLMNLVVNEL